MRWSFEINETSNGVYLCTGKRNMQITVERHCVESRIYLVYADAYEMEASLGTNQSEALYLIFSGAKPDWDSKYDGQHFGSWYVAKDLKNESFIFDGRDFRLSVVRNSISEKFETFVKDSGQIEEKVFQLLIDAI